MATPSLAQAAEFQQRQALIASTAGIAVAQSISQRRPWTDVLTQLSAYQNAAVLAAIRTIAAWASADVRTNPQVFAGVSSNGFSVLEPIIATIDRVEPAPAEPLPAPWWSDPTSFEARVQQLIADEVADAARTASQVEFVEQGWTRYIRLLNPPSCDRCAVLAGRVYRYSDGFARHPGCDCVMVPVDAADAARSEGLISDPNDAVAQGLVTGLSKADRRAILDGADIGQVVNAKRAGIRAPAGVTNAITTEVFGRQVKATLNGTTRRAQWRRNNPSRLIRLRPESIYEISSDRADALRLLKLYGYVL